LDEILIDSIKRIQRSYYSWWI